MFNVQIQYSQLLPQKIRWYFAPPGITGSPCRDLTIWVFDRSLAYSYRLGILGLTIHTELHLMIYPHILHTLFYVFNIALFPLLKS